MYDNENNQIEETAEASGSTEGSTGSSTAGSSGGSTDSVEPVQALEIPELDVKVEVKTEGGIDEDGNAFVDVSTKIVNDTRLDEVSLMEDGSFEAGVTKNPSAYHEKKWEYAELKKILPARMKKKISKCFIAIAKPARFTTAAVLEAEQFFEREFPKRSPWAVYQKAMEMKRAGKTRIVLL